MRIGNLFVFYGQLLTKKQQEILKYYYIDDFSLGEIAENLQISRQAVYDTIKRSEKTLEEYEDKLSLSKKFSATRENIGLLIEAIDDLINNYDINLEKQFLLDEIIKIKEKAKNILEESS